jgi:hypothetical protein
MNVNLPDHGLPLVALKEQHNDLVVTLLGGHRSYCAQVVAEISAIQMAIAAMEAVIADLDDETSYALTFDEAENSRGLSAESRAQ